MSNLMRYIKDLEDVGFGRNQAEAQIQMVLGLIREDLVTKSDFAIFQERTDNRLIQFQVQMDNRFTQFQVQMDNRFTQFQVQMDNRFTQFQVQMDSQFSQVDQRLIETEFRLMTRLGFLMVSTASISVAVLTWLIKV